MEVQPEINLAANQSVGIDLGLSIFAAMSNGEKAFAPSYKKLDQKIRRAQRRFSRRKKGSKRRELMRVKIAKLKAKETNTRKDFLHKLSTKVVSENQAIAFEDLNVSSMLKNRKLSRAISKAGWSQFRTMCEAKSDKFNREFVMINRWTPTSQTCSDCGYQWGKLDLSVREVVCMNCNSKHCRDHNAARNIEQVGVGHTHDSKWTGRECKTSIEAKLVEPSIQLEDLNQAF